jgi:hypothetical protein
MNSSETPINSDEYNLFANHALWLYRKSIRDFRKRGKSANATLNYWLAIAEEKYIFPYINSIKSMFCIYLFIHN